MKGNDSTVQGKTKHTPTHTADKSCNLENTKRQTQGPNGPYELFLLTVPIEEVARCLYITVQIIFPLNIQKITITLEVIKWRGGEDACKKYRSNESVLGGAGFAKFLLEGRIFPSLFLPPLPTLFLPLLSP